jgi:hypothetical protein
MLKLIDLIELAGIKLHDFKIHCATGSNQNPPLEAFFNGTFKHWQEEQNQKNFQCKHILSLIYLEGDQWLFAGIYAVNGVKPGNWKDTPCYLYATEEVSGLNHLTGKVIVQFKKAFRASYLRGLKHVDHLLVAELRNKCMTIGDFPDYKSVLLSYRKLQTIVQESNKSWHTALSIVSGVYLITDTSDGKLYVGSAYGGEGIWQRWAAYAQNGHGENKEIVKLLSEKGNHHSRNFQFSLLEVCDIDSNVDLVLKKENHWKTVLKTREFGLNKN